MVYTVKYTNATAIYLKSGLTAAQIDVTSNDSQLINEAESELESEAGRSFKDANSVVEYLNGGKKDIFDNKTTAITLQNYPIQSITEFLILNVDATTNTTYDTLSAANISAGTTETDDYWLPLSQDSMTNNQIPYGRIKLKTDVFPPGVRNIKVTYTYGYASVPSVVANLAAVLASVRAWVSFLGGSYNAITSYSIPQQSVTKGEIYERGLKAVQELTKEAVRLWDRIGRKPARSFTSSGLDR